MKIKITNSGPKLISFWDIYGKELDVKNTKTVNFASGPKNYYVVEFEGREYEVPEDMVDNSIPNNYEGKTPEQVWNAWTEDQREHFLADHNDDWFSYNEKNGENLEMWANLYNKPFSSLPKEAVHILAHHIGGGQYGKGGEVDDFGASHTVKIHKDMPYMASLDGMYDKELPVVEEKTYHFASGPQIYYVVKFNEKLTEIPRRFTEAGYNEMAGKGKRINQTEYSPKEKQFNWTTTGFHNGQQYVVGNHPETKKTVFGFWNSQTHEYDLYEDVDKKIKASKGTKIPIQVKGGLNGRQILVDLEDGNDPRLVKITESWFDNDRNNNLKIKNDEWDLTLTFNESYFSDFINGEKINATNKHGQKYKIMLLQNQFGKGTKITMPRMEPEELTDVLYSKENNWADIGQAQMYVYQTPSVSDYLKRLHIIDLTGQSASKIKYPDGVYVFIAKVGNRYYYVNTEGYDYARYAVEIPGWFAREINMEKAAKGTKIENMENKNYYYLKIGNRIIETFGGFSMTGSIKGGQYIYEIIGHNPTGIMVREHTITKSKKTEPFEISFYDLTKYMNAEAKGYQVEGCPMENMRDEALLDMEIADIKNSFKIEEEKAEVRKKEAEVSQAKHEADVLLKKAVETETAAKDTIDAMALLTVKKNTEDAYMRDEYGNKAWERAIKELSNLGFSKEQIEWILNSKYMRWASDEYKSPNGRLKGTEIIQFYHSHGFMDDDDKQIVPANAKAGKGKKVGEMLSEKGFVLINDKTKKYDVYWRDKPVLIGYETYREAEKARKLFKKGLEDKAGKGKKVGGSLSDEWAEMNEKEKFDFLYQFYNKDQIKQFDLSSFYALPTEAQSVVSSYLRHKDYKIAAKGKIVREMLSEKGFVLINDKTKKYDVYWRDKPVLIGYETYREAEKARKLFKKGLEDKAGKGKKVGKSYTVSIVPLNTSDDVSVSDVIYILTVEDDDTFEDVVHKDFKSKKEAEAYLKTTKYYKYYKQQAGKGKKVGELDLEKYAIEYLIGEKITKHHAESNNYMYQKPGKTKWFSIPVSDVKETIDKHGESLALEKGKTTKASKGTKVSDKKLFKKEAKVGNYYHFRLNNPKGVKKCAVPSWASDLAGSVYEGAKITTCQKDGEWFAQNVMIPTKNISKLQARSYAQQIALKIKK